MTILYVLLALLLLGILIAVHEFGHFISARACGIEVKEFSLGFGPALWKKEGKKGTTFSLRPIPLGGYCMFYGDTDDDPDGAKQDDPRCYNNQPAWKRLISVISGPLMNFVLAFLVAAVFALCYGTQAGETIGTVVYDVTPGSPAEEAGLQSGDLLLTLRGESVEGVDAETLFGEIPVGSEGLDMTVLRGEEEMSFHVDRRWNEEEGRWLMGVSFATQFRAEHIPLSAVPAYTWNYVWGSFDSMLQSLGMIFRGQVGLNEMSGPVGIVQLVARETRQYGLNVYLQLLVLISVNLGMMNLLPIPGLDGSHAVFMLLEMILRKPVPQKVEAAIHACGYVLLLGLMLLITFNDVWKLFG